MIGGLALQIDWSWTSVVVALCALAATRQLPEGTLQATRRWPRVLGAHWRVAPPVRLVGRWHLVGLPLLCTEFVLVEPRATGQSDTPTAAWPPASASAARLPLAIAQLVGSTSFVLVAFLLPIAVASHGLVGLILAVCVLANTTMVASAALAWVDWRLRAAYGVSSPGFRIRLQSPFSIPHAASGVLDQVLAPLGAAATVRRLMPDAGLYAWLRPHVHDHTHESPRDDTPAVVKAIVRELSLEEVAAALVRPERCVPGERYCPRCGSCYEPTSEACADCPGAPALA